MYILTNHSPICMMTLRGPALMVEWRGVSHCSLSLLPARVVFLAVPCEKVANDLWFGISFHLALCGRSDTLIVGSLLVKKLSTVFTTAEKTMSALTTWYFHNCITISLVNQVKCLMHEQDKSSCVYSINNFSSL